MEIRNIETLVPNPNNDHSIDDEGKRLLLNGMSLGNFGVFLITPEGMIINGNNRFYLRTEAGWDNKEVPCRILTTAQDEFGFYPIIDGEIVKQQEVIPHHYISLEALYKAYAFVANGEAAHYDKSIAAKFPEWGLNPNDFQANFFPPQSITETLKKIEAAVKKKKYQIVVPCDNEQDMDAKFNQITALGYAAKRKI